MSPLAGIFAYEYVSGCVNVFDVKMPVEFYVTNRGETEELARVFLFQQDVDLPRYDSQEHASIPSGATWSDGYLPDVNPPEELGLCWVRILTTSANLVPSVRFFGSSLPDGETFGDVYFAPGDFAVFELPHRPFWPESVLPTLGSVYQ